jgi:hypothetical protein
MENLLAAVLMLFLDARADPISSIPWGALILLLAIVFILAVSFTAGLVFLLIRLKRRKASSP